MGRFAAQRASMIRVGDVRLDAEEGSVLEGVHAASVGKDSSERGVRKSAKRRLTSMQVSEDIEG